MKQFYLSFADSKRGFRGAVIAEGLDFTDAYGKVNERGLNPGGEVAAVEITPKTAIPPGLPFFKLLTKDDLQANGGITRHGDMPKKARERVEEQMVRVCKACNEGTCTVH